MPTKHSPAATIQPMPVTGDPSEREMDAMLMQFSRSYRRGNHCEMQGRAGCEGARPGMRI